MGDPKPQTVQIVTATPSKGLVGGLLESKLVTVGLLFYMLSDKLGFDPIGVLTDANTANFAIHAAKPLLYTLMVLTMPFAGFFLGRSGIRGIAASRAAGDRTNPEHAWSTLLGAGLGSSGIYMLSQWFQAASPGL